MPQSRSYISTHLSGLCNKHSSFQQINSVRFSVQLAPSSLCLKLLIMVLSWVLLVEECNSMAHGLCSCVLQVLSSDPASVHFRNAPCLQLPKLVTSDLRDML